MGRPRLYATSVERKAAWRRRHGMAVRPHYPSAAAKQAAYRARKLQGAQDLAAQECVVIQHALRTRALADQCWGLYALIDDGSRDADMPSQGPEARPLGLVAGASAHFYGMAAARVRQHRRALQRLAHVRAIRGAQACAVGDSDAACARKGTPMPAPTDRGEILGGGRGMDDRHRPGKPPDTKEVRILSNVLSPTNPAMSKTPMAEHVRKNFLN